ncbi:hypothetical protein [Psychromonas sp. L1A2]|uniref:hypothetical protein n=1 Tax=Psychromonas sp. L1A2 TaxID=2686356 RepID=UPI0013584643|nr:hypothetical protein [Psychromonas sp. L1A2]
MFKSSSKDKELKVYQANSFYNYTLGFDSASIDLLKTAEKFLKEGISTSVFFSDFNCIYIDNSGTKKYELLSQTGNDFTPNEGMPKSVVSDLHYASKMAFHEKQIKNEESSYFRTFLPPILLDNDEYKLPIFASLKVYSDGIGILSFQLDASWDGLGESEFLSKIVNIFKYYFKSIWIDSRLQKLDAKALLHNIHEDSFLNGKTYLTKWKIKQLIKKNKQETEKLLTESLQNKGNIFEFGDDHGSWVLHQIVGTEKNKFAELTIELCRSIYCNAICSLIVNGKNEINSPFKQLMWQGRPSITLLRFKNQPDNKEELYDNFSHSISKILFRADKITKRPERPRDLRFIDDFCLHGNRAILLSTWLKSKNSPIDAWEDPNTASMIFAGQARTELIEYYNLKIARACAWAQNPQSNEHLLYAYKILASSDNIIHQSSNAGEIVDSLSYLMGKFGTTGLINSGKESAKYYLDELKYNTDKIKNKNDRTLTFIFGLVGAASLAQFAVHPLVKETWPLLNDVVTPFVSFGISGITLILLTKILSFINNK